MQSGVAARLYGVSPSFTLAQARSILQFTAEEHSFCIRPVKEKLCAVQKVEYAGRFDSWMGTGSGSALKTT